MKSLSSPPDIPDEPAPPLALTDSAFVGHVSAVMQACAKPEQLDSVLAIANGAVVERGLEQAIADLAEAHRIRIRDRKYYLSLVAAMRGCAELAHLGEVWRGAQSGIKGLPETWRAELAAEKDRLKAKLSAGAAG
ncbi:MAG TPA: hypothetical protein VG758_21145 [Hyphomicrobiaceae bacterium]|jgi:hypothetical protein|nr:hypothetical protein [Hyphomicrobiaceae bacterium]